MLSSGDSGGAQAFVALDDDELDEEDELEPLELLDVLDMLDDEEDQLDDDEVEDELLDEELLDEDEDEDDGGPLDEDEDEDGGGLLDDEEEELLLEDEEEDELEDMNDPRLHCSRESTSGSTPSQCVIEPDDTQSIFFPAKCLSPCRVRANSLVRVRCELRCLRGR